MIFRRPAPTIFEKPAPMTEAEVLLEHANIIRMLAADMASQHLTLMLVGDGSPMNNIATYNSGDHRREPHSRIDDWLGHLPEGGIRAMCSWERNCAFAREPERSKVGLDCRLTVAGVTYEVTSEVAGETVVVWWGLFDQEL